MSDAPRRHRTRVFASRQTESASMWKQGTTWLQITFVVLGLVLTFGGWLLNMQFALNSHTQQLSEITRTLGKMDDHLSRFDSLADDRGQRLSRIEAKMDMVIAGQSPRGGTTNFVSVPKEK